MKYLFGFTLVLYTIAVIIDLANGKFPDTDLIQYGLISLALTEVYSLKE